jgi:hypothetical protein
VIHDRQRLTLGVKAGDDLPGVHPQLDHFESNPAAHRLFLLRDVNDATAAFANLLQEFLAADASARLVAGQ